MTQGRRSIIIQTQNYMNRCQCIWHCEHGTNGQRKIKYSKKLMGMPVIFFKCSEVFAFCFYINLQLHVSFLKLFKNCTSVLISCYMININHELTVIQWIFTNWKLICKYLKIRQTWEMQISFSFFIDYACSCQSNHNLTFWVMKY